MRPDDEFYPMSRYKKKFGSPDAPKNRALGHKKAMVAGHKGVVVPGDDGESPWKIRNLEGLRVVKDTEEDCGSDSDREHVADATFQGLKNAMEESYKEVAQGAMRNILEQMVLTDKDRAEEERRQAFRRRQKKTRVKKHDRPSHVTCHVATVTPSFTCAPIHISGASLIYTSCM